MKIIDRYLTDVLLLESDRSTSQEGLQLTWSDQALAALGVDVKFVQDNHSFSEKNVSRGLHYQIQHPQAKLIIVVAGSIVPIVVDLCKSSKTFGQSALFEISANKGLLAWIPPGFAHGFYVPSDYANMFYSVTDYRFAEFERALLWSDPALHIDSHLLSGDPVLSDKDRAGVLFPEAELFN
jgi:dTDP-4-dehydrorhamnose 3,5-epimerase